MLCNFLSFSGWHPNDNWHNTSLNYNAKVTTISTCVNQSPALLLRYDAVARFWPMGVHLSLKAAQPLTESLWQSQIAVVEQGPMPRVLLTRSDAVASRLTHGSAAFIWKLCCHWLIALRPRQIAVVTQDLGLCMGHNHHQNFYPESFYISIHLT